MNIEIVNREKKGKERKKNANESADDEKKNVIGKKISNTNTIEILSKLKVTRYPLSYHGTLLFRDRNIPVEKHCYIA